jgi:hypothetical protein
MPSLDQRLLMFASQSLNFNKLVFRKSAILCPSYGFEPELRDFLISLHVDVGRLAFVGTKEDKTIRPITENCGHR